MTIDSHTPLTSFELAALYFAIASFGASCQLNHFTLEGDDTLRSRTSHRGKIHETPGDVSRGVWGSHLQECHSEESKPLCPSFESCHCQSVVGSVVYLPEI